MAFLKLQCYNSTRREGGGEWGVIWVKGVTQYCLYPENNTLLLFWGGKKKIHRHKSFLKQK